ncbi:hypothetical protein ABTL17_19800, partial [Acinetobacter baumannii]
MRLPRVQDREAACRAQAHDRARQCARPVPQLHRGAWPEHPLCPAAAATLHPPGSPGQRTVFQ